MTESNKIKILKSFLESKTYSNELDQIRSKALLKEISSKVPSHDWKYNEQDFVLKLVAASNIIESLSKSQSGGKDLENLTKQIAIAWENIARLREGTSYEKAILNAAVSYEIAGYQANASCLMRKLGIDSSTTRKPTLELLTKLFLERMFVKVIIECKRAMIEPSSAMERGEIFEAAGLATAADGLLNAAQFFLTGDDEFIGKASNLFLEAEEIFVSIGNSEDSNLVSAIYSLLPIMRERSTWTVLRKYTTEDDRWIRYLKLLARGIGTNVLTKPSVSELWPSQLKAIEMGLLDSEDSIVVRMPTSAGKTRVAELAMVRTLLKSEKSKCIYLPPYKSLVWEIERTFADLLGDLGFRVSSIIGNFDTDALENFVINEADILVMTPEKFDLLQRLYPSVLKLIKIVIIDEGHIISDQRRGLKFELLLTRTMMNVPDCRFVLLSAVISNETLEDLAFWFNNDKKAVTSDWRPSIQRFATFEWKGGGFIRFYKSGESDGNKLLDEFVPNILGLKEFVVQDLKGKIRKRIFPNHLDKSQLAAELAFKFVELGSVLVFCTQPSWAESVAKALYKRIDYVKKSEGVLPRHILHDTPITSSLVAEEWLGKDHIITTLLREGIGIHHSGIPEALKKSIETDFRQRRLSIIAATNTLAQGVNLPIRTVIIHSSKRYNDVTGKYERIPDRDYWNISGRAGRAGEETEGLVIHICRSNAEIEDFKYFLSKRNNLDPMVGALLTALKSMLNKEITESMVAENLDADLLELLVEGYHEDNIVEVMERSLVSIQARRFKVSTDELRKAFVESVKVIKRNANEADWKVFSESGLSTSSCKYIKEYVLQNSQSILSLIQSDSNTELLDLILDCVSQLREMQPEHSYPGDFKDLLTKWVDGQSVTDITSNLEITDTKPEELSKFIEEMFSYLLPWGITAFIRITTHVLGIKPDQISIYVEYLPTMIKFGVPNPSSAWAMAAGIPVRKIAMQMGAHFIRNSKTGTTREFLEWLGGFDYLRLQSVFHLKSPLLEEINSIISKTSKNHYLSEKIDLHLVDTWIAGIAYENRRMAALEVKKEDILRLVRDYENAYDHNAVKVFIRDRELGFIERSLAQLIAPYIDTGLEMDAMVTKVIPSKIPRITIKLRVLSTYNKLTK